MVADRVIFVAARRGGGDHRFERVVAVAPGRVHVKVAAQIAASTSSGNRVGEREVDLVETAAQLGRNVLHAQRRVDARLFGAGRHVAGLEIEDAVLADAQALADRVLAQLDVVLARTGEVLQQIAVEVIGQHAQVDLQSAGKPNAGLGRAFGQHRFGARPAR